MHRFWPLLLLLLVAHGLSLRNDFAQDDRFIARALYEEGRPNPMVSTLRSPVEYFTSPYWRGIDDSRGLDRLYRPVPVWSYALVYAIAGRHLGAREALPQHVVNLALYAFTVWLVWRLLTMFGVDGAARFLATAVFVVHPLHVEAVSSIVGRAELLAFAGGAGFVLLGARAVAGEPRRWWFAVGAASALFLGLCSKENAIAFVPLAALVWTVRERRHDGFGPLAQALRRNVVRLAGLAAAPIAVWLLLRANALAALPAVHDVAWTQNPLFELPAAERVPTAVMIQGFSLWKALVPWPLSCDYGPNVFRHATSWFDVRVLGAAAAFAVLFVLALRAARRDALPALAFATFVGLALPTSNILLAIGTQFAERLCFSPSLALPLLVGALWPRTPPRWRRPATIAIAAWCAIATTLSFVRTLAWRDDPTLYRTDAVGRPDSLFVQINAAVVAGAAGDQAERQQRLRAAVAAAPEFGPAWSDLGMSLYQQRDLDGAEQALRRAIAAERRDTARDAAIARTNLGLVLVDRGRLDEAMTTFSAALPEGGAAIGRALRYVHDKVPADQHERWLQFLVEGQRHDASPAWRAVHGLQLARMGRHPDAVTALTDVRTDGADPLAFEARMQLANSLSAVARHTDALTICEELEKNPRAPAPIRRQAAQLRQTLGR